MNKLSAISSLTHHLGCFVACRPAGTGAGQFRKVEYAVSWPGIQVCCPGHWQSGGKTADKAKDKITGKIDINSASSEDLQRLHGVDAATAEKIIAGRPYTSNGDLLSGGSFHTKNTTPSATTSLHTRPRRSSDCADQHAETQHAASLLRRQLTTGNRVTPAAQTYNFRRSVCAGIPSVRPCRASG